MLLEYIRMTQVALVATKRGNVRVRIDDSGQIFVQKNVGEPPGGQDWTGDYAASPTTTLRSARQEIEKLLGKYRFTAMPPLSVDDAASKGRRETLTHHTLKGVARTVTVDRARAPDFEQLVQAILRKANVTDLVG